MKVIIINIIYIYSYKIFNNYKENMTQFELRKIISDYRHIKAEKEIGMEYIEG